MARTRLDRGFERRLSGLVNARERAVLSGGLKGLERESLRVRPDGHIAQTPHPAALGSALTHPHITTDYSEALIELVTPPFPSSWEVQQYLCDGYAGGIVSAALDGMRVARAIARVLGPIT